MNKKQKYRRQKQKKSYPWVLLAFGGVLIIAAIFLFAGQNGGDGSGTPVIAVDQQRIDFGDQKFATNLTFAVKVTNTGDGTLRFKEAPYIEVLEGC